MKILVEMRHPAHFHHFKNFIRQVQERDHEVLVLAVSKDILLDLLDGASIDYLQIGVNQKGLKRKFIAQIRLFRRVLDICRSYNPDILIGRPTPSIVYTGALLRKKVILFDDDDFRNVPLAGLITFPIARDVLSPDEVDLGPFLRKKIGYKGNAKLAYLHPAYFQPDANKVEHLANDSKPFYIVRFSSLDANHDIGVSGITNDLASNLVSILSEKGNVFISSERSLSPDLEPFRITLDPLDIHHAMFYADLVIADSQTMTVEACLLGTPSIRYNDLVGRVSVLEEMEEKYELTFGIKTDEPDTLIAKIEEILSMPDLKAQWQLRRDKLLADKIDVTAFMIWFVENYPESARTMRRDPNYQLRFQ